MHHVREGDLPFWGSSFQFEGGEEEHGATDHQHEARPGLQLDEHPPKIEEALRSRARRLHRRRQGEEGALPGGRPRHPLPRRDRRVATRRTPPDAVELPAEGLDLEAYLEEIRAQLMTQALERTEGIQTQAAELLGMSFRSFRYYAKKAGLKGGDNGDGE
jgi:DNA-binding NtrC family response regulator